MIRKAAFFTASWASGFCAFAAIVHAESGNDQMFMVQIGLAAINAYLAWLNA